MLVLGLLLAIAGTAQAQVSDPAATAAAAVARDQARRAAEAEAAQRVARENAPQAGSRKGRSPALGPFPEETPCFTIHAIVIDTKLPHGLGWVPRRLAHFRGRCAGHAGLNYILASLQASFLDLGYVTTRAGLPEQDLASGTLHIAVVPGIEAGVRGSSRKWEVAAPLHKGDLVNVRAIEQGLDQMRRVPGTEVAVDLAPGALPGDTLLEVTEKQPRPVSASISANNFAGATVGHWQGTGQASALDLLGLNDILSVYYNSRVSNPSVPANSTGTGGSFELPLGWWTSGVAGSVNHFGQHVIGQVRDFDSRGTLSTVAGTLTRVLHRDGASKTSLQLQLQRRWGRSYIDDIEIALQHQDTSDLQVALIDRHRVGRLQVDGELAYRIGLGILGAQHDQPNQPASLPTARYRIGTLNLTGSAPVGKRLGYYAAFGGQWSGRALFGSDQFSVGGPYTVRGYDSDHALVGRSGWYVRQELNVRACAHVQPYALMDVGGVNGTDGTPLGLGAGVRGSWRGFSLDTFGALAVTDLHAAVVGDHHGKFGLSVGWGF